MEDFICENKIRLYKGEMKKERWIAARSEYRDVRRTQLVYTVPVLKKKLAARLPDLSVYSE